MAHNPSLVHVTFSSKYITISALIEEQDLYIQYLPVFFEMLHFVIFEEDQKKYMNNLFG